MAPPVIKYSNYTYRTTQGSITKQNRKPTRERGRRKQRARMRAVAKARSAAADGAPPYVQEWDRVKEEGDEKSPGTLYSWAEWDSDEEDAPADAMERCIIGLSWDAGIAEMRKHFDRCVFKRTKRRAAEARKLAAVMALNELSLLLVEISLPLDVIRRIVHVMPSFKYVYSPGPRRQREEALRVEETRKREEALRTADIFARAYAFARS